MDTKILQIIIKAKDQATAIVSKATNNLSGMMKKAEKGSLALAAGLAVVGAAFVALTAFGFDQTRQIQTQVAGIKALTKNSKEAGKVIKDMVDFVQGKPFDRLDAIGAAKQLLAMGVATKGLNKDMDLLGRMAIIAGTDLSKQAEILGKITATGKLTGMEFRQLAQNGINVGGALSKHLGVSLVEVREKMFDGEITAKIYREAMNKAFDPKIVSEAGETIDQGITSMTAGIRDLAFEVLGIDFTKMDGRPLIKTGEKNGRKSTKSDS